MHDDELRTKAAIEQVYIRYCDLIDDKAFDRLDEVFTHDTIGRYALPGGVFSETRGLDMLIGLMHANLGAASNCGATHHNVGNFRITLAGERAKARVRYYAVHRGVGDFPGAHYSMWGEYDDELVLTAEGWRVSLRAYRSMITEGPIVTSPQGGT